MRMLFNDSLLESAFGMIVPGKWLKNVIGNVLRCARIDFVATEGLASVKFAAQFVLQFSLILTTSSYACKTICHLRSPQSP